MKMRSLLLSAIVLAACTTGLRAEPPEWSGNPDETIVIKTLPGQMMYDQKTISVSPGAKVKLTLDNPDDLQHNLVLLKPDEKDKNGQKFAADVFLLGEEAIKNGWVPKGDPRIIVASALLDPKASEDLYFVAPDEPGDYPYVCTVPGHAILMNGMMQVKSGAKLIENLTWSIYRGDWGDKLPDFSKLEPVETGKAKNGLIDLSVAKKQKGKFGVVFEGKLIVPKEEKYEFTLTSDDGSRLIIDGEGTIDNDGIHPMQSKKGSELLQEGIHSIRVDYFEGGGNRGLSLIAKTKSLGEVPLSADVIKAKQKKSGPPPMILRPENGEAITHRAFIPGVSPRAIAVGYPGGINISWDADVMNLALIWRGGFVDVAPHWNGRGSGSKPAGYDQVKTGQGFPLQVLESLDEPWVPFSKGSIKYERDKADPQNEMTFDLPHPDYQFAGYRLDEKRFPTFRYSFQEKVEVEDGYRGEVVDNREAVVRTIGIKGKAPKDTFFRLADSGSLEKQDDGSYLIDKISVTVEGGEVVVRDSEGRKELLVALDPNAAETSLTVTYHYQTAVGGRVRK